MFICSSVGSLLNRKDEDLKDIKKYYILGIFGFIGALIGGYLNKIFSEVLINSLLLVVILISLIRIFIEASPNSKEPKTKLPYIILGTFTGTLGSILGLGGAMILKPALIFFGVKLKKTAKIGLLFVVFSSSGAFLSYLFLGMIDYEKTLTLSLAAISGTFIGKIALKKISIKKYKYINIIFYLIIMSIIISNMLT